jgi:photosystem II stability/assembly factor-like uncharacterized protein
MATCFRSSYRSLLVAMLVLMLLAISNMAQAQVTSSITKFNFALQDIHYFEGTTNILILDENDEFWFSQNEGTNWTSINFAEEGYAIMKNPYFSSQVIVLVNNRVQYITNDNGVTWNELNIPLEAQIPIFSFHPDDSKFMLFHGKNCALESYCPTSVYYTTNGGRTWTPFLNYAYYCMWGLTKEFRVVQKNTIYCIETSDNVFILTRSDDYYQTSNILIGHDVYGMKIVDDFFLVATENVQGHCPNSQMCGSLFTSTDGINFNLGKFPPAVLASQYVISSS